MTKMIPYFIHQSISGVEWEDVTNCHNYAKTMHNHNAVAF